MNTLLHKNNLVSDHIMTFRKSKPSIQTKLTINAPGDIYEQEADAMADRVMRMSANETRQQPKPMTGLIGRSVQRKCTQCEEEEKKKTIMRKAENGNPGMHVSSSFASSLNASKGGGSSLPKGTRSFMEKAFSTDFSAVRMHTDSQATEMSKGINAKAFTYGNDIYFREGQYNPGSNEGKQLLAHELTHVMQQERRTIKRNSGTRMPDVSSHSTHRGPSIQRFTYGSGVPPAVGGRRFVVVPAAHRTGRNGIDQSMALIDSLISRADWRGRTCRNFFGATPRGHCPSGETLAQLHAKAVIWYQDIAPANVLATTLGLGGPNIGYSTNLFDIKSRWALAASILHEYIHLCNEANHTVGDNAKLACGLPNI